MSVDAIHRFIERLDRDPKCAAAFQADARLAMKDAGLREPEIEKLYAGTREALAELDVHPLLQIRYFRARFPEKGSFMSVKEWADQLPLEVRHG